MSAHHTPGPWRVGDAGATVYGPKREDGSLPTVVAKVSRSPLAGDRVKANARLIAAAPELLAALEGLLDLAECEAYTRLECGADADERKELDRLLCAACAAIAKAKGGAA